MKRLMLVGMVVVSVSAANYKVVDNPTYSKYEYDIVCLDEKSGKETGRNGKVAHLRNEDGKGPYMHGTTFYPSFEEAVNSICNR